MCNHETGGECNATLGARFERPAARDAVMRMFTDHEVDAINWEMAGLWWLKTALLMSHPRCYDSSGKLPSRPVWRDDTDAGIWRWMIDRVDPPEELTLWVVSAPSGVHAAASPLPRSVDRIWLPHWSTELGEVRAQVATFGIRDLQFHLLLHPGWSPVHPFEDSGLALRLWPPTKMASNLAIPSLDAHGLRAWLDLWGPPARLMVRGAGGGWRLGVGWHDDALNLEGVDGFAA